MTNISIYNGNHRCSFEDKRKGTINSNVVDIN